jgi:hypothetical protein
MRPVAAVAALLVAALVLGADTAPAEARTRWHVGVSVGVGPVWWGPYPYGWGPYPYAYPYAWYAPPPYYVYPPTIVVEPPPVYVEAPPAPAVYWYYCAPSQAYYPHVATCTEPWIKVPPRLP